MRILAIDTALPAVSACVLDFGEFEPLARESAPMERGHAEALLPLITRVVGAVDGGFGSIDRVAVTVGPGSFTGIRIGLSAAQGIALARKIELVGVSTLAALAAPHILEPFEDVVAAAIDARNGQVFIAAYGPDGRGVLAPRRMGAHEALRALGDGPLRLVGSGAALLGAAGARQRRRRADRRHGRGAGHRLRREARPRRQPRRRAGAALLSQGAGRQAARAARRRGRDASRVSG